VEKPEEQTLLISRINWRALLGWTIIVVTFSLLALVSVVLFP
jgi:hypothetical protein